MGTLAEHVGEPKTVLVGACGMFFAALVARFVEPSLKDLE